MRFAIFTHVPHHQQAGRYYAYSPYVREMTLWFKYAKEIEVVAPLDEGRKGEKETAREGEPYKHSLITFTKVPSFHLLNLPAALASLIKIPFIFFRIIGAMRRADHLHIRCPGNIGLLAVVAQIFFPKKPKTVKYAGNWDPGSTQPWTYRVQKWILDNTFLSRNIKVLVYGDWQGKSKNIVSFFTASFTELERGIIEKDLTPPYKFIYTGNLVEGKGIFEAITLIDALNKKGVMSELEIYGGGVLKDHLENFIQKESLQNLVKLKGRRSLEELKEAYKKAHFVILLSKSEGWPKALAEGMWYGCVPVATSVSCVPWMLGEGGRGILIPDLEKREENREERGILLNDESQKNLFSIHPDSRRDTRTDGFSETDIKRIVSLLKNPVRLDEMSRAAQEWSQQYTLEKFERAIQQILENDKPTTYYSHPTTDNRQQKTYNSEPTTDNPPPLGLRPAGPEPKSANNKPQTLNSKQLRVLQMVDSLNPGGAERMAVNLANELVDEVKASYLCCTREEGMLKEELDEKVGYIFLNKNHSLDLQAFWKLREFIKSEQIDLVHTHGTSWFWGVLLKVSGLKIKLVWHDHYGNRLKNKSRNSLLINFSMYFDGVLVLSDDQESWAKRTLKSQNITKIPNFIVNQNKVSLKDKRRHNEHFVIVSVANLRKPKNHLNLLKAFKNFSKKKTEVFLQLIGKDYNDSYSAELKRFIKKNSLGNSVEIISGTTSVMPYLNNADLAVLSSDWEALPLSVLEYGLAGLPVIATAVGECPGILKNRGILVAPGEAGALKKAIMEYYESPIKRKEDALALQAHIKNNYISAAVLPKLMEFYIVVKGREGYGGK